MSGGPFFILLVERVDNHGASISSYFLIIIIDKEATFRIDEEESEEESGATFRRGRGRREYPVWNLPSNPHLPSQNSHGYEYALVLPLPLMAFLVATAAILMTSQLLGLDCQYFHFNALPLMVVLACAYILFKKDNYFLQHTR